MAKKNNPVGDPAPSELTPDDLGNSEIDYEVDRDDPEPETLLDLFGPDESNNRILIHRSEPRNDPQGNKIMGYLGTLPRGEDVEYIAQRWGGGVYKAFLYVGTKYMGSRTVTVAGPPLLFQPNRTVDAAIPQKQPTITTGNGEVNGISLDGDDAAFMRRMERYTALTNIVKASQPTDINYELVMALVKAKEEKPAGSNITEIMQQVEALGGVLERLAPKEAGSGTGILDLVKEGLKTVGAMIEKSSGPRALPIIPQPAPTMPQLAAAPAAMIEAPAKEEGSATMSFGDIADKAVGYIVAGFIKEPPLTVEQTVDILRTIIPDSDAVRAGIRSSRSILKNMAETALDRQIEPDPETVQKFSLHFDNVFDMFTATKTPEQIGGNT